MLRLYFAAPLTNDVEGLANVPVHSFKDSLELPGSKWRKNILKIIFIKKTNDPCLL